MSVMRSLWHVRATDDTGNDLGLTVRDYKDLYLIWLQLKSGKKEYSEPRHVGPQNPSILEQVPRTANLPEIVVAPPNEKPFGKAQTPVKTGDASEPYSDEEYWEKLSAGDDPAETTLLPETTITPSTTTPPGQLNDRQWKVIW